MSINPNALIITGQLSSAMTRVKNEIDDLAANRELNVIEGVTLDGVAQTVSGKIVALDLSDYAKKADVVSNVRVKGSAPSFAGLPNDAETGDMYNITAGGGSDANGVAIKSGDNVVWTGSGWDNFGGLIDLSGKVDKVTSAVTGNIATWGASGAFSDGGVSFATDTEINGMLDDIFGTEE